MYNTHATTKIVFNPKLNTFRVLVAFNTNKVTVQNSVYISGDLLNFHDSFTNACNICQTITNAFNALRINYSVMQITKQAQANMCKVTANTIMLHTCYN